MKKNYYLVSCFIIFLILSGCSKHVHPASTPSTATEVTKPVVTPNPKVVVPKVIVVNDQAASRTIEGRYYYDVNGKRYWRNNKDGKYYLFNKSMYTNADFNPVKN